MGVNVWFKPLKFAVSIAIYFLTIGYPITKYPYTIRAVREQYDNWDIPDASLDAMIVPMSIQLLLENAIKHNVISKAKPLLINVRVKDDFLIVGNEIRPKSTQLPSTKVGLKNISKRYNLISSKSIEITNDGNRFMVSLPLLKRTEQNH